MRFGRKKDFPIRNSKTKTDKRKVIVASLSILCLLCPNLYVSAYTVDDLRELQGKPRLDTMYTPNEKSEIWLKWYRTEYKNRVANMLSQVDTTKLIDEPKRVREELQSSIQQAKDSFTSAFTSGAPVKDVLSAYTSLNTEVYKLSKAKEVGEYIEPELEDNVWSEVVKEIERIEKEIASYVTLGSLGTTLRPPINGNFHLTSIFGVRTHPVLGEVEVHHGIDLSAPTGTPVFTVWAGVVSRVYESERGGKTIEVEHGNGLFTRYLHLDSFAVKENQTLRQYELIGASGSTGIVTGEHLHFEVILDGESVDPLYFFGKVGANALRDFLSRNPEVRDSGVSTSPDTIKDPTSSSEGYVFTGDKPVSYTRDGDAPEGSVPIILEGGFSAPAPSDKILDLTTPGSSIMTEGVSPSTSNTPSAPSTSSTESVPSFDSMDDLLDFLNGGGSIE